MSTYLKNTKYSLIAKSVLFIFKSVAFSVVIFLYCFYSSIKTDLFFMFDLKKIDSVCCVVSNKIFDENLNIKNNDLSLKNYNDLKFHKVVSNGNKKFLYLDNSKIDNSKFEIENCLAILESDYIELETDKVEFVKHVLNKFGARCVFAENILNCDVEYYFVPFLKKFKFVDNLKVNLQIVWSGSGCLIGYPMIYTSF